MRLNDQEIAPEGHASDLFTDWSVEFIQKQSGKAAPFFLYLAYNAPHFPIQPPESWLAKVKAREPQLDEARAANVAFVEHLDSGIAKVWAAIKDAGIEEKTIIVFSSDNGGSLRHSQSNGELRGGKQDHWEGGIRVPTCVVWPGKIPLRRSDAPGMTMDLLPTLCDIVGANVSRPVDGVSLKDVWLGQSQGDPNRTFVWVRREGNAKYQGRAYYAIRQGPWKLLQNSAFEPMQLVNVKQDPLEEKPVTDQGETVTRLRKQLMLHQQQAGKIPWQPQ